MKFVATLPPGDGLPRAVELVLTALGLSWAEVFRTNPGKFPPLYSLGVRFAPEKGTENWQSPPELVRSRAGDCEDLVCYRFAELVSQGHPAAVECVFRRELTGLRQHVRLRRGNEVEDPSLVVLGRNPPTWQKVPL